MCVMLRNTIVIPIIGWAHEKKQWKKSNYQNCMALWERTEKIQRKIERNIHRTNRFKGNSLSDDLWTDGECFTATGT